MAIYRFPPESEDDHSSEKSEDKQFEGKLPDFIYIDEHPQEEKWSHEKFYGKSTSFSKSLQGRHYPYFLRAITLIVGLALTTWVFLLFVALLAISLMALLTLLQFHDFNRLILHLWRWICRMSAFALALLVATLSPAFGFGIAAVYLTQHGESMESGMMGKIFNGRFKA